MTNNRTTFADAVLVLQNACPGLTVSTQPNVLESHGRDCDPFQEPGTRRPLFIRTLYNRCRLLVRAAADAGVPLVPSGGRTGLSGGAVAARGEVVVSFDRMRKVLDFNAIDRTVTVEPGVITASVQELAIQNGLYYPVSFAAEGSSQIGGNVATNAGGIRVLKYGLDPGPRDGAQGRHGARGFTRLQQGVDKKCQWL